MRRCTQLREAVRIEPRSGRAHYYLGVALQTQQRLNEAAAEYQASLALNERFYLAHLNLGSIFLSRRQYAEGKREFERAAELEPDDGRAVANLAALAWQSGDYPTAITYARRALQIDGSLLNSRRLLIVALEKTGRVDEAIDECRRLVAAAPNDAAARSQLERLLAGKAGSSRLSQLKRYSADHSRSPARTRHLMKRTIKLSVATIVILVLSVARGGTDLRAADDPPPQAGDFVARDFHFASGETLPELRLHYRTLGTPARDGQGVVRNAVLIMHGTTGEGGNFLRPEFAGQLFGKGQFLDASRYYLILPDGIGHGRSSRPSEGLHARFPHYGYRDMVAADYRLLTEGLKVNHLRLVMGTSMGGMHTWLWGEQYPDFMDALLPLASLPTQISGRNRIWRRAIIDAIRNDPEWKNGEYTSQPPGLRTAAFMLMFMSSNPVQRQKETPTREKADAAIDQFIDRTLPTMDANNTLYALDASSDYDPGPDLEKIKAPLLAINTADDLINPPELGILEREIARVKHGKAIVIPLSDQTRGHGTHTLAAVWKNHLAELLRESEHAGP